MKTILAVLLAVCFLAVVNALAEDIYISQNGNGNGTSAASARSLAWFNTSGNWSATVGADGKIGPGDTVHFVGTISSQAIVQRGGVAGNPILLKIDPGAKFSAPTWTGTGAIYLPGQASNHLTIEGGNPDPVKQKLTQKDIEATAEFTGSPTHTDGLRFIYADGGGDNLTIRNMWLYGAYIRDYQHPSDKRATASVISVTVDDDGLIENVYVDHGETGITLNGAGPAGELNERNTIRDCVVMNCSNGMKMGSKGITKDAKMIRNRIDHMARWGGIESGGFHSDGIQTITTTAGTRNDNLTIAYNHIGPNVGMPGDLTACIFLEDFVNGPKVYNNFIEFAAGHHSANSAISNGTYPDFFKQPFGMRSVTANNTVILSGKSSAIGAGFSDVYGNVVVKAGNFEGIWQNQAPNSNGPYVRSNYNIWHGPGDARFGIVGLNQGQYTFAAWKNMGFDLNSLLTDPMVNANGTLKAGSPAIGFAPTQTFFNDDINGNVRTPPWDAGAFKYGAAGPSAQWVFH